jgi:metal-sulfur cluster biosynthetic enzyme
MAEQSEKGDSRGMSPRMIEKIDRVLERVKDPESGLPVSRLGLVKRFRYSEREKKLFVFTDVYPHLPKCITCAAIARTIVSTIIRDLTAELEREFPELSVEFV